MKASYKVAAITIPLATITFILGRIIWPDPAVGAMMPTASQLPFFIFLSVLESIAFGLGVSFAVFAWPHLKNALPQEKTLSMLAFISITWMLISWWPHDNMHRVNGMNMAGLLRIEYTFHFTLILAGLIVAWYFWKLVSKPRM